MESVQEFLLGMTGSRPIEIAAVVLGLVNVTLIIRRSIWNYPFGIAMVILYAKIFHDHRLYSEAGLQVYFLLIQLYGWWYWLRGRGGDGLVVVVRLAHRHFASCLLLAAAGTAALGGAMERFTDADRPYWDGSIAVLSVIAQFLMSRRLLESWVLWILVDVLAIGLYVVKGLHPTAALYAVFLVLASTGLYRWTVAWRRAEAPA